MSLFRFLLIVFFVSICAYTFIVVQEYGWNLFEIFFGELTAITWSGQFNLDFSTYLVLSALWIAWSNNFSARGIVLALFASVLGIMFFAPYLLYASYKGKGDLKSILMGQRPE